ncbi:MAG: hypothetical protein LUE98_15655 [Tannerellaceae bacterium]|nr:hypothetical protein [Tannerellaceae bacterium]MCD8041653.1 hypothetical protein [Tannerellaceae bacterium]MCD8178762.1 hypothetical protein [Tannerellaceae bacterium]
MKEVIAVLTQKGSLSNGIQENTTVNLFEVENEKVKGVESVKLENTETLYVSLFMALKKVTRVYAETINKELDLLLSMIGISIRCKDDLENDSFIQQFVFE